MQMEKNEPTYEAELISEVESMVSKYPEDQVQSQSKFFKLVCNHQKLQPTLSCPYLENICNNNHYITTSAPTFITFFFTLCSIWLHTRTSYQLFMYIIGKNIYIKKFCTILGSVNITAL